MTTAPVFSSWDYIYPGPHTKSDGKIDERTWFSIPIELNVDNASITYLTFPYGAGEDEVRELVVDATGTSWIS